MFKGESIAINGVWFEIHAEQPPKGQFQDTLDVLKIYSSTMHKLDIDSLNVLFIDLTEPTISVSSHRWCTGRDITYKRYATKWTSTMMIDGSNMYVWRIEKKW